MRPEGSLNRTGNPIRAQAPRIILVSLAALMLTYTIRRSMSVSFSWDESWTFLHHVLKDMFYQQAYDKMGGNHHLLNVWLMWVSMKLFGTSELALRLPNLFAHVLYLYATACVALRARTLLLAVAVFLLLNLHPYLLDFFSLARGYGLACGWMMLSLWQMWRYYMEDGSTKRLGLALLFASLAALSHVIMINYLLAFDLAFLLLWCVKRTGIRQLALLVGATLLGLAVILPNALGLFGGGSLNFGCDEIWYCTVRSFGEKFLYHHPYETPVLDIMKQLLLAVLGWCVITITVAWRGKWLGRLLPAFFGLLILTACLSSFLLQQVLFDVPLPQSRTALFLLPLIAFVLAAMFVAWERHGWVPTVVAMAFCVPLWQHQDKSFNTTYAVEWKPSGELRKMVEIINNDHLPITPERPVISLGIGFESSVPLEYYRYRMGLQWLTSEKFPQSDALPMYDYYIVEYNEQSRMDRAHATLLFHSEATNTSLYRDDRHRGEGRLVLHRERSAEGERPLQGNPEPLRWIVPEGQEGADLVLYATAMVFETTDENWLSLNLEHWRNGKLLEEAAQASHAQVVNYSAWNKVGVELRPSNTLRAGDEVRFQIYPVSNDPVILLETRELLVTH